MQNNFSQRRWSVKCIEESLSPTFFIVAQYWVVVVKLKLITSKNCKIEQPELLQIAATIFQQLVAKKEEINHLRSLQEKDTHLLKDPALTAVTL